MAGVPPKKAVTEAGRMRVYKVLGYVRQGPTVHSKGRYSTIGIDSRSGCHGCVKLSIQGLPRKRRKTHDDDNEWILGPMIVDHSRNICDLCPVSASASSFPIFLLEHRLFSSTRRGAWLWETSSRWRWQVQKGPKPGLYSCISSP